MAIADAAPPAEGWPRLSLLAGASVEAMRGRHLFLDLETTGLAGGAGTYAFLVGLGWFEGCSFRVRQFFLANYTAEQHLLQAVCAVAQSAGAVVTYNGKSFDLPVLETRSVIHRLDTPFSDLAHVDMLHPARRLWRGPRQGDGESARLTALEQSLCGHHREGDVPGFEIPARYFQFVRTGEAQPLAAVLEHNRLDLLSLAVLTARAARLLEDGAESAAMAREALGLGQLYEKAGLSSEARAAFARAVALPGADAVITAEAFRALAAAWRRARDYERAAEAWRAVLEVRGCPALILREAADALAVHHEHRRRDPRVARSFALQSLRFPATPARREALQHRLARLSRKLGDTGSQPAPLF